MPAAGHYGSMMTRPSGFALSAKSWAALASERGKALSILTSISRLSSATSNASTVERILSAIARHWPEQIDPADLGSELLARTVRAARAALLTALGLDALG